MQARGGCQDSRHKGPNPARATPSASTPIPPTSRRSTGLGRFGHRTAPPKHATDYLRLARRPAVGGPNTDYFLNPGALGLAWASQPIHSAS